MPVGWRSHVPEKITSSMRDPRSVFADCSPNTQEMASAMFDLPHPFGPMIAATPSPGNFSSVRSQNDLKPRICSFFSLSTSTPSHDPSQQPHDGSLQALAGARLATSGWLNSLADPVTIWMPSAFCPGAHLPGMRRAKARIAATVTVKSTPGQEGKPHILWVPRQDHVTLHTQCSKDTDFRGKKDEGGRIARANSA